MINEIRYKILKRIIKISQSYFKRGVGKLGKFARNIQEL